MGVRSFLFKLAIGHYPAQWRAYKTGFLHGALTTVGTLAAAATGLIFFLSGGCEDKSKKDGYVQLPMEGETLAIMEVAKDNSTAPAKRLASITGVKGVYKEASAADAMPKGKADSVEGGAVNDAVLDHSHG